MDMITDQRVKGNSSIEVFPFHETLACVNLTKVSNTKIESPIH